MQNTESASAAAPEQTVELSLLDHIIADGRMAHDELQKAYAKDLLAEFATQVAG